MINLDIKCWSEIEKKHIDYVKSCVKTRLNKVLLKTEYKEKPLNEKDKEFFKKVFSELLDEKVLDENKKYTYFIGKNLKKINSDFEKIYFEFYKVEWNYIKDKEKSTELAYKNILRIKEILDYILNYDAFNSGEKWGRHKFLVRIGIKVCPYCNRNYITSFNEESGKEKTTADADHYYVKKLYPILQMNIYNLIPSCQICNSRMKLDSDIRHLYPYTTSNKDNLKFYLDYNSVDELYNFSVETLKIRIENLTNKAECDASIKLFKLAEVYEVHNNIVYDIIKKVKTFIVLKGVSEDLKNKKEVNEALYLNLLLGKEVSQNLCVDSLDLKDIWFDFINDETDIFDEPLLKLKRDIYMQLKEYIPELN